ncbi:transglutaminaseTgpA domain-containing protein [Glaciecola siphonariae]|uniref:TransglutaminaseTgpA domain-containing protein n=1 Tax=Glaciecola siphonariae TaxID=521012 RepID=A0ABV9LU80_9ALTE
MRKLTHEQLKVPGTLVSVCFALAILPLSPTMMSWVWILFLCALGVVWAKVVKKIRPLNNATLNLLAIFCMLLLVFFSGKFGLLSTMINLLIVAGCLKLITMRSFADFHLIIVVVVFLVACGFIHHQDLLLSSYYTIVLFATLSSAYFLNSGKLKHAASIKQSMKLIAQTIPITVILFIMVPRLPPLWEAASKNSSSTGLSENLTPGDIANLAQSGDLAFRAEFTDTIPAPEERYWRAIVLDYFNGTTWSMSEEMSTFENTPDVTPFGEATRYLIIAEPNDLRWQYSLDYPIVEEVMSDRAIQRNSSYQLFTAKDNTKASLYIVNSYMDMPLNQYMSQYERQRHLQTPREGNPRTRAYIADTIDASMDTSARVSAIVDMFKSSQFAYTLKPPLMTVDPVDQFLFEYQRGFCSHYATSLAYMLRLADVPARVVTGYQGGELQNKNILTVRQYDAHAWVEYWAENEGWKRIDPTAMVAPNRLMSGLFSSITEEEGDLVERPFNLSEFNDAAIIRQIRDFLVLIDHQWTQSVLRFDQDSQRDLIKKLFGDFNAKNMTTFMFVALGIIVLFIALVFLPYKSWFSRTAPSALSTLLAFLEQHGMQKKPHETLKQFSTRISPKLNSRQQKELTRFVNRFYRAQYANKDAEPKEFERLLYSLKLSFKSKR